MENQIYNVEINNGMHWKDVIKRRYLIAAKDNKDAENKAKRLWNKEFEGSFEQPDGIRSNVINKTDNGFEIKLITE